jgi:hypothetical protein
MVETVEADFCVLYVLGVASSEDSAFQTYESDCKVHLTPHSCPAFTVVTITQDGKITHGHVPDQAQVTCKGGLCTTFMP